jgi:hypothetical protein
MDFNKGTKALYRRREREESSQQWVGGGMRGAGERWITDDNDQEP